MLIVGLAGGPTAVFQDPRGSPSHQGHDSATALLEDGRIVAALEEERLDRIKHSNKAPLLGLRACLEAHGITLNDVDHIAYYGDEQFYNKVILRNENLEQPRADNCFDIRQIICHSLGTAFRCDIPPGKLWFVGHHAAHAMSAAALSGFEESLVVTFDAEGDHLSGAVYSKRGADFRPIATYPAHRSLGSFYVAVIAFLGYRLFDEYKVMGLAPYGDPSRFRSLFRTFYQLLPDGQFEIRYHALSQLFEVEGLPRLPGQSFDRVHRDVAAALQESFEEIAFHIVGYHRDRTKHVRLCLAGGVALNSTMTGKLLNSGWFDDVFVQPASHDAGCAVGAALAVYHSIGPALRSVPLEHVYWGSDIPDEEMLGAQLARWTPLLEIERCDDVCARAADLLAAGEVLGWVQGRSEFGPRALGNRSILADPRPVANRDRINAMVKKREGYRPFAPSVLEEDARDYFTWPTSVARLPFMVFVVDVQADKRQLLGAVTHVDGTARIQTVSRTTNERFWRLLTAFKARTGVPILLNTSFNNDVEPIVNSVDDAVAAFLTTELQALAVGNYLVRKTAAGADGCLDLVPTLPFSMILAKRPASPAAFRYEIRSSDGSRVLPVSGTMFHVLSHADGVETLRSLLRASGESLEHLDAEVRHLWSRRVLQLRPPSSR